MWKPLAHVSTKLPIRATLAITHRFSQATGDEAGNTIYYNGLPTIRAKATYVKEQGLGGVMIWSLDYDGKGDRSLLSAIYQTLRLNR